MSKPKKQPYRTISARVSPEFYQAFCNIRDLMKLNTQEFVKRCVVEESRRLAALVNGYDAK